MAKFYGNIGFVETVKTAPGVYMEKAIEKPYKGDVVRNSRRWEISSDSVNSDININNSIIILADEYAINHSPRIRYVEWMGSYWQVKSIDIDRPRLTLELGGVYERTIEPEESEDSVTENPGEDSGID